MDEIAFSEDEIREQLEKLGYYNVPNERLQEFKRDLEQLVRHERSKNSSLSTLMDGSSTDSETNRNNHRPRAPLDEAGNRRVQQYTTNGSSIEHSKYGKENVTNGRTYQLQTKLADKPPVTTQGTTIADCGVRLGEYSLHSDTENHQTEPLVIDTRPKEIDQGIRDDVSVDSSTCSERRLIKRKVLRKKDGHAQVFDESTVTESEPDDVSSIEERFRYLDLPDDFYHGNVRPAGPGSRSQDGYFKTYYRRPQSASSAPSYRLPDDYDGPKALIRPMTGNPHTRNIKKSDPVARYQQYRQSWDHQRAPGEKMHKNLRWNVREQMLYHDEVVEKKTHKVYVPNGYVVPSDKKRKALRWQIRQDLAQGIKPPSMFD